MTHCFTRLLLPKLAVSSFCAKRVPLSVWSKSAGIFPLGTPRAFSILLSIMTLLQGREARCCSGSTIEKDLVNTVKEA